MPRDAWLEERIAKYLHLHGPATTGDLTAKLGSAGKKLFRSCVSLEGDRVIHQVQSPGSKDVLWAGTNEKKRSVSDLEARSQVHRQLLLRGQATVEQLAARLDLDEAQAYQALQHLRTRGLVLLLDGDLWQTNPAGRPKSPQTLAQRFRPFLN